MESFPISDMLSTADGNTDDSETSEEHGVGFRYAGYARMHSKSLSFPIYCDETDLRVLTVASCRANDAETNEEHGVGFGFGNRLKLGIGNRKRRIATLGNGAEAIGKA